MSADHTKAAGWVVIGLGLLGAIAFVLSLVAVQPFQFKVVDHTTVWYEGPRCWSSVLLLVGVCAVICWLTIEAGRKSATTGSSGRLGGVSHTWPLILSAPLAAYVIHDQLPPFYFTFLLLVAGGWTAYGLAGSVRTWPVLRRSHALALTSIAALIVALTIMHVIIQVRFFDHLMFGHADIGHFAEELKNALAGRGLRSDSFDNTRLGWHFVPLMYALVPGYALWPSPVYLMVCNALFIHIVALPAYFLARRISGSDLIGWIWALAWLLLPSLGRLVYANTYGFQWNNVTMPVIALMITAGVCKRWRLCILLVGLLCLCRETAAAAAIGWGMYVVLFTRRRWLGAAIAVGSIVYLLICTGLLIPHFGASGTYERMAMFGDLGSTWTDLLSAPFSEPRLFFGRLMRPQLMYFLLMLFVPMAMVPVQGWRLLIATIPTLVTLALVENEDWLSIKFWHQASILPFVFFAGILAMKRVGDDVCRTDGDGQEPGPPTGGGISTEGRRQVCPVDRFNLGLASAVLVSAALGHYLFGFSPTSKAYEPHAANAFLQLPDPRMDFIRRLRTELPHDQTVLATERIAAHFTDYKRLYTGRRIRPVDMVIIDRRDYWDTSRLPDAADRFFNDPDYELYDEFGSIIVFRRRPDAPPVGDE